MDLRAHLDYAVVFDRVIPSVLLLEVLFCTRASSRASLYSVEGVVSSRVHHVSVFPSGGCRQPVMFRSRSPTSQTGP